MYHPIGILWGYNITVLETLGTLFGMLGTWLATKDHISTWFFGILNCIFFFFIFYYSALYSDMLLQIYFFISFIYGWRVWSKAKKKNNEILALKNSQFIIIVFISIVSILILAYIVGNLHIWFSTIFQTPVAYKFLDTTVAVLSIVANMLLAKRYFENWFFWIIVNVLATYIYYQKNLYLISFEYLIFLFLAIFGYTKWKKIKK